MGRCAAGLTIALIFVTSSALAESDCGSPADRSDGWPTAAPEQEGMNAAVLCALGPQFDAWKEANAHAVVVARHGKLVYERYFTGTDEIVGRPVGTVTYDAEKRHDLRSITKSVTALLVGIGIDRGWIKGVDEPVFSFFPEYADLRTPEKDRITIRHLLTMSAGFAWDESLPYANPANSERPMDAASDPYRYILEQQLATEPGRFYNYCGCSAVLLEAILQKSSGKKLDVIARETLFEPLGVTDVEWIRFANGDALAHAGLRLRARDLAKIGQLVLNRGAWQGRQIVPATWINDATAVQIGGESIYFYGYQWWLGRSLLDRREIDWAAGVGYGDQRLYVIPAEGMVVAVYAGLYGKRPIVGDAVLKRYVLPAISRQP
jgi:CubicO group peptidase (beta-lactamase class C family)